VGKAERSRSCSREKKEVTIPGVMGEASLFERTWGLRVVNRCSGTSFSFLSANAVSLVITVSH
jgi:hypothetical protein